MTYIRNLALGIGALACVAAGAAGEHIRANYFQKTETTQCLSSPVPLTPNSDGISYQELFNVAYALGMPEGKSLVSAGNILIRDSNGKGKPTSLLRTRGSLVTTLVEANDDSTLDGISDWDGINLRVFSDMAVDLWDGRVLRITGDGK